MRIRSQLGLILLAALVLPVAAQAQATGTMSFNAPYRAFARHEFGATLTFPDGGDFSLEGQFRFGYRTWDIGFRGGFLDPGGLADKVVLVGVEGRNRVLTHSEDFPVDGALVVGVGGNFVSGNSALVVPAGLSLGRRLDVEGSNVSIVPYVQPTVFLISDGGTDLFFSFGFGGDFRLSRVLDARVSIGLGDLQGIGISAVWVH